MSGVKVNIVYADDGSIISPDDGLAYESYYCDRCLNKPDPDPPGCPAYELLIQYGCVAGAAKEKGVQAILGLFFPPHPTVDGKLDRCRMFREGAVLNAVKAEAEQNWQLYARTVTDKFRVEHELEETARRLKLCMEKR